MAEFKTIRLQNPRSKKRTSFAPKKKAARRRSNPALEGGVLTLMSNPKRKRSKKRNPWAKAKSTSRRRRSSSRRRRNPWKAVAAKSRRRSTRRRNPFAVAGHGPSSILKLSAGAAVGMIGTRAIVSYALKEKNSGLTGYGANIVTALLLTYGAGKMFSQDVAAGVLAGGVGSVLMRLWDDKVSGVLPLAAAAKTSAVTQTPVQGAAPTMGDPSFSDDGLGRALTMGDYRDATFPLTSFRGSYSNGATAPALVASGTDAKPKRFAAKW